MEEKFKNKYLVSSPRLSGWDYGSHGLYFVTLCTKDRMRHFGEIDGKEAPNNASLQITEIGKIAVNNWIKIPQYHPYVELDEFVIMPDHIHGILFINKPDKVSWEPNKFGAQRKNLASIIRGYKSSVKQYTTLNSIDFSWQPGYYDRVIRDNTEHENIRQYIYENPDKWHSNKANFENIFTP